MENTICEIKYPSVFMHTSPDIASEACDELLYGTAIKEIGRTGEYVRCETEYGYSGYLHERYFGEPREDGECRYIVKMPFADLLPEPVYRYRPIISVPCGSVLCSAKNAKEYDRFVAVVHRGHECYAPRLAIEPYEKISVPCIDDCETIRKLICDNALAYLGVPYRWAGKSSAGIDCSGLCFMAYYLVGLPLWRDSYADTRFVHEIPYERARQGDIVYFRGHAGIYIGDGEYVHASSQSGRVTVNSLHRGSIIFKRDIAERFACFARSNFLEA